MSTIPPTSSSFASSAIPLAKDKTKQTSSRSHDDQTSQGSPAISSGQPEIDWSEFPIPGKPKRLNEYNETNCSELLDGALGSIAGLQCDDETKKGLLGSVMGLATEPEHTRDFCRILDPIRKPTSTIGTDQSKSQACSEWIDSLLTFAQK